jgi:hypothetical protein
MLLVSPAASKSQARQETARTLTPISGLVTDPTGAVVRGAEVSLVRQSDGTIVSTSASGLYGVYRLEAREGVYRVLVRAPGFAQFQSDPIEIQEPGKHALAAGAEGLRVDAVLDIAPIVERVEVPDSVAEPTRSGREVVLSGRDVQQLPLDPVALKNELMALAGSSSALILVDGFSGGNIPSRDNIREIRINQNPYSAENDTDTVTGVIQVLTQPGTQQLHGELYLYGDSSSLNAANPFAPDQPAYYADGAGGELSGSMGRRVNAYTRVEEMQQRTNAAVDALVLDGSLGTAAALYTVPNPRTTLDAAARIDVKLSGNNTAIARYSLSEVKQDNYAVGQLALSTQGLNQRSLTRTLQLGDTLVLGPKLVEEIRMQYIRTRLEQKPVSLTPTLLVQGAFTGGGNAQGLLQDHQDRVELQESLSVGMARHFLSVGGRLRVARDANLSQSMFNGEFVFASLDAYQATLAGLAAGRTSAQIVAAGGGASEYVVAQGNPNAAVTVVDGAAFAQDNWRLRQNLKLSYGLRFETQNFTGDHADWAPRVGFSWGLGGSGKQGASAPKYIVHGGGGVFYQRFGTEPALRVRRFDGIRQQQYVVESPNVCTTGTMKTLTVQCMGASGFAVSQSRAAMTVYRLNPTYQAPYFVEGSIGVERPMGQHSTVSVSYLHSHGVHTRYSENANAPLPGTYSISNPASGTRPDGSGLNEFEYESEGTVRTRQLTTGVVTSGKRFRLFGNYILQFNNSDAENDGTFPLNRLDMREDDGRSVNDQRHVATVSGSVDLPYGISSWAYLRAATGAPFNIVVGDDLNGDTQYNDRPAFATDLTRSSVVRTPLGAFDTRPTAEQTIVPRNYGDGPGSLTLNLAVGKKYGFGTRTKNVATGSPQGAPEPRYTAELWVLALNVLNHPNLTPPIAVLGSPLFGRSVGVTSGGALSPTRAFDMQLSVHF